MKVARKPYFVTFAVLTVLTAAEVGVIHVPGISHGSLVGALVAMAIAKAALVLLSFMHLGHETRALKLTVMLPFLFPAGYAVVLMLEAAWRATP